MFIYDRDIRLSGMDLWLDAKRKKPFSFVSHAHADHSARHERILATPATLALARERRRIRRAKMKRPSRREPVEVPLDYNAPMRLDGATVTLLPAGHILGSAQILVERGGRRLLYSGDFCHEATSAAEDIEIPTADTLIMECTYGLPEHRFPPRESTVEKLLAFVDEAFADGLTPVLLCYALGKGQEVLRILTQQGYSAAVESETYALARTYESFGIAFGGYRLLDGGVKPGEVVITPNMRAVAAFTRGRPMRSAALTGWAIGGFSHRARSAHSAIPLSDHADFDGLIDYAAAVKPEIIYILHGPEEFGRHLREAGFRVGELSEKASPQPGDK